MLYELDFEVIYELGSLEIVKWVESLNGSFVFIEVLVDIVKIYLVSGVVCLF